MIPLVKASLVWLRLCYIFKSNAIKQQQAMGFLGKKDADQAIAAVQGQDLAQEKKLKAELNKIAQDELVAQQALIDAQTQLTQVYKEVGDKLRANFLPNQQPQGIAQPINVQQQAQAQAFAGIPIAQQRLDIAPNMQAPIMSFEPVVQNMKTFTDKLAEVSQAFSNISMTHTLNVDGQINIGGVDISSIATQLRNSLGEYIGQAIEDEFNKRASTFRTA